MGGRERDKYEVTRVSGRDTMVQDRVKGKGADKLCVLSEAMKSTQCCAIG